MSDNEKQLWDIITLAKQMITYKKDYPKNHIQQKAYESMLLQNIEKAETSK